MNFGYLIIVAKDEKIDYHKMAMMLAYSIKRTQKPGYDRVALATDDRDSIKLYSKSMAFDRIIYWYGKKHWDSRSYMNKITPWKYTVCLDADMIFLRDYSHWIDYFISNCELYVANKSFTYRGEVVTNDFYRKAFVKNDLPNLYSFFTFFKKDSELATEFFTLGRYILKNPVEFSNTFLSNYKPKIVGTDEAFALSAKILDIDNIIAYPLEFPKVVHLKGQIQNWPWSADIVTNHVGFYLNKIGNLKIGNFQQ
jgi:hypothetical protein